MMKRILSIVCFALLSLACFGKSTYFYYETVNIPAGISTVGCNMEPSLSGINFVFPSPPNGTTIYKFVNGTYKIYVYDVDVVGGWDNLDADATLGLGESVIVIAPAPFEAVLLGKLHQTGTTTMTNGFQLLSSKTLASGGISSVLGLSPNDGDSVYKMNPGTATFSLYTFIDGQNASWVPSEPIINFNDGFFYFGGGVFNWNQSVILPNNYNSTRGSFIFNNGDLFGFGQISLYVGGEQKAGETLWFDYSPVLTTDPVSWSEFGEFSPPVSDQNTGTIWTIQHFSKSGYIRISTL